MSAPAEILGAEAFLHLEFQPGSSNHYVAMLALTWLAMVFGMLRFAHVQLSRATNLDGGLLYGHCTYGISVRTCVCRQMHRRNPSRHLALVCGGAEVTTWVWHCLRPVDSWVTARQW